MPDIIDPYPIIKDFITGKSIPDVGAEGNRQAVEKLLVMDKGFEKDDIVVGVKLAFEVSDEYYQSRVDLVITIDNTCYMALKCAAGSLGSREREIVAAARILKQNYQIPLSVVSDGISAIVLDTVSGKKIGEGMEAVPSRASAIRHLSEIKLMPLDKSRYEREKLIFRSYDMDNINVIR